MKNFIEKMTKIPLFLRKGEYKSIKYFDFIYKEVHYAYDISFIDGIFYVDLVIRNNKDIVKKLSSVFSFDKPNKTTKIISENTEKKLYDKIILFNDLFKKRIDEIIKFNVSIIVTNYNREGVILNCLKSLQLQRNDEVTYEVIIVDDSSTDKSLNVISDFIKNNKLLNFKLHVRSYNFGGPSLPRNDGINLSSGEYIYFVDSDDKLDEYTVRNAYRHAKKCNSDICMLKISSESRGGYARSVFLTGTVDRADFFSNRVFNNPLALHLFKKSFLKKNQIMFDLEHNIIEDLIFVSHCFSKTNNISILGDRDYYYLSDYEDGGDNISLHGGGGIQKSFAAYMKSLHYYMIAQDSKKYSSFLNILVVFIRSWLIGGSNIKDKLKIIKIFSMMINYELIDYRYILDNNVKYILYIKNNKYDELLDL